MESRFYFGPLGKLGQWTVGTMESYLFIYFFRATPVAYGGSQARSLVGAIAASLRHSHSNVRSEQCLRPTPQLTAMPDP